MTESQPCCGYALYVWSSFGLAGPLLEAPEPSYLHVPSWSPDGRYIAFTSSRVRDSNHEIFRMRRAAQEREIGGDADLGITGIVHGAFHANSPCTNQRGAFQALLPELGALVAISIALDFAGAVETEQSRVLSELVGRAELVVLQLGEHLPLDHHFARIN